MKLSRIEQETIILFNEQEHTVQIYTHNEKLKVQIADYIAQNPDKDASWEQDSYGAVACVLPKNDLRVALKKPRSEKQLAAAKQNIAHMLESRGIVPDGG